MQCFYLSNTQYGKRRLTFREETPCESMLTKRYRIDPILKFKLFYILCNTHRHNRQNPKQWLTFPLNKPAFATLELTDAFPLAVL